jgi:hypothetical protein
MEGVLVYKAHSSWLHKAVTFYRRNIRGRNVRNIMVVHYIHFRINGFLEAPVFVGVIQYVPLGSGDCLTDAA